MSATMSRPSFSFLIRSILLSVTTTLLRCRQCLGATRRAASVGAELRRVYARHASATIASTSGRHEPQPVAGARDVADRLQAARAAQHRFDDLRLRYGVAVADLRVVGHLLGRRRRRHRSARSGTAAPIASPPAADPSANACSSDGHDAAIADERWRRRADRSRTISFL